MLWWFLVGAGGVQLGVLAVNGVLPGLFAYRENLARTDRLIQQIFYVHNLYILMTLAFFGGLCAAHPCVLLRTTPLATWLTGFLAVFWGLRVGIQVGYYDPAVKKRYWRLNLLFLTVLVFLAAVFAMVFLKHLMFLVG